MCRPRRRRPILPAWVPLFSCLGHASRYAEPMGPLSFLSLAVLAGALVSAGVYWSPWRRLRRRVRRIPLHDIANAPEHEPVRIRGRLEYLDQRAPLVAPLSKRPCVAWRIVVEESSGMGSTPDWAPVLDESESRSFLLRENGTLAHVDGALLTLVVQEDAHGGNSTFTALPSNLKQFCADRDIQTTTWFLGKEKRLRYREGILEAGECVSAAGIGTWRSDPSLEGGDYRTSAKRFELRELSTGELIVSDEPSFMET